MLAGEVRAVRDAAGALHIPAAELQAKQYAGKQRRKKRKALGRSPRAPWETSESGRRRKKKKAGKKLVPGKKKKRVRKTKPSRQRFREALAEDTRPSRYFEPPTTPRDVSRAEPMPMADAAQRLGNATRDFVMARPRWERLETGRVFHDLKVSFRNTYGERRWKDTYAWIVDEWGLEDYIFDYEALRDS